MSQPIKRHVALQPLSREHHLGLLLCYKIGRGFDLNISPDRIKKYADWFYENHLVPHFDDEEKYVFPILGAQHEMVMQAMAEHVALRKLFTESPPNETTLRAIETQLEQHIRFEERIMFNEIQAVATPEQLQHFSNIHKEEDFCENEVDAFWL
jgi:iron-sulfur cluster repair protein YtfE (RIC family)